MPCLRGLKTLRYGSHGVKMQRLVSRVLARLRLELDEAMQQHLWPTTFSIGLVSFSPPLGPVEDMIQTADAAMYAAKSKGKNQVVQRYIAV